ncbi:SIMPL domain-containing protein [Lyngbya sp. CCY1209]|uniref:SIMPL domain-containing protein n=1 Tax=Lyngbya sp. CCY1209 TaxID=2886103 RepID=UPI002D204472|nr:SIMPL domain-containing protein [Lyngbya sp. CCY1209]MEB3883351.1 SIMPL domain-containing protein [Lyngbya sp. CCY1209]
MHPTRLSRPSLNPWGAIAAFSLGLGFLGLPPLPPVVAQEQQVRTLTVSGEGIVTIPTTLTRVQLGVEVSGKTAEEVQQQAARQTSAVVELLRSRNVQKLETAGIRLNPNYTYRDDRQELTGYTATNTVTFRLETEAVGNLLDEAVNAGATRIDGVSFIASDSDITTAQQQALQLATREAQRQADAVLDTLNLTRREIVNIQINSAGSPPPVPMMPQAARLESADASTPVIGGEQEVRASVTLQISY